MSGVGPEAAVKALKPPIPDIAQAIDEGDLTFLKSLPGIGQQRAKEIIAKLQGKMGKFGLIQESGNGRKPAGTRSAEPTEGDAQAEALEVLLQLQYKKEEAREMLRKALSGKTGLSNAEEILNEVYKQKKQRR